MLENNSSKELIFYDRSAKEVLSNWFNNLQERDHNKQFNGRVWRAELRRADSPYDTIVTEGFRYLLNALNKLMVFQQSDLLALAVFASVAAHARNNNKTQSFAAQLGAELKGRPCLSRLRFDRLLKAKQPEDLCGQLIKAVKLRGDEGVNIISLADGIFLWMREWQAREEHRSAEVNPFKRNSVRWASEYLIAAE